MAPIAGAAAHHPRQHLARVCVTFPTVRSEEHTSELQSLMRISYAAFCLKKKMIKASLTLLPVAEKNSRTNSHKLDLVTSTKLGENTTNYIRRCETDDVS